MHALALYTALLTAGQLSAEAKALVDWLPPEDYCRQQAEISATAYERLQEQAVTAPSLWQAEAYYAAGDEVGRCLDWWNLALQAHESDYSGQRWRTLAGNQAGRKYVWVAGYCAGQLRLVEAAALCRDALGSEAWSRQQWPPPVPLRLVPLWP